jgi:DUF1680 family protein
MRLEKRLRSLPLHDVRMTGTFWSRWQARVRDVSLPIQYRQIVETGRLENFRRAARGERGTYEGRYYNDSDVYKWIEAGSYLLSAMGPDPRTSKLLDEAIAAIAAAQMPDGYLDTYFQVQHPELRWRNLNAMHEMYCMGHLIEAAVAHHEATGSRTLLDVALRVADHIDGTFGPGKRLGYCGHQEIELALLKLARTTGERRYEDLARWLVEARGSRPSPYEAELEDPEALRLMNYSPRMLMRGGVYGGEYCQDHAPLREQSEPVGHAVRAVYFYAGATEAFAGMGDTQMEEALERIWTSLTQRRMYVTGGIGPSSHNEGFTGDYDLPPRTAYAETCAACGLIFWARRLFHATGDGDYADVMELALYNAALAGISAGGDRFFYVNPLESRGGQRRQEWFDCACCPPNVARLIASLGHYAAAVSEDAFALVIPCGMEASATLAGAPVKVRVESDYPWSGEVQIEVDPVRPAAFELMIRLPGWARDAEADFPAGYGEMRYQGGFACMRREWKPGDRLTFRFDMAPAWLEADPRVLDAAGRVALRRGPLIYCLEECDLGAPPQLFAAGTELEPVALAGTGDLEGITMLEAQGTVDAEWQGGLYEEAGALQVREARARYVPYFHWANRAPGCMQVWTRRA